MASRSLTDVFIMMRNKAVQSRLIYSGQNNGIDAQTIPIKQEYLLPPWIHELEEAQFELLKLKTKIAELTALQNKNLCRPSLDDNCCEERQIEDLTHQITAILNAINKIIQYIKSQSQFGCEKERRLKQNVLRTLAIKLQEFTSEFRMSQNRYLDQIKSREQRLNMFDNSMIFKNDPNSNTKVDIKDSNSKMDEDFISLRQNNQTQQETVTVQNKNLYIEQRTNTLNSNPLINIDKLKNINKEDCRIS